jgi:hypothetical protein
MQKKTTSTVSCDLKIMDSRLNKDKQVNRLVDLLLEKFGERILIKDFWDADLCAIGFCDKIEKHLIYISTFGLPIDRFNIVLENLSDNKENPVIVGEFNDISFDRLEKILISHLMID